jgi:hypothetical protein
VSVIGSVLPRGRDVGGLLRYLFQEGRAGEHGLSADHTAPRLIAAWDHDLPRHEPAETAVGRRDVRALAAALWAPVRAANVDPASRPVYHLAIAAAKDPATGRLLDKMLSDGQWADIAAEYVHQIGLAKRGDEQAVRWVAVRHADDHIHVVATPGAAGRPQSVPTQRPLPSAGGEPDRRSPLRPHPDEPGRSDQLPTSEPRRDP